MQRVKQFERFVYKFGKGSDDVLVGGSHNIDKKVISKVWEFRIFQNI